MQINTMNYNLIPLRVAIIKKLRNNKCRQGCGEKYPVYCWQKCKLVQSLSKWHGGSTKIRTRIIIFTSNSTSAYLSEIKENIHSKRYMHPHGHCSNIYNNQNMETTSVYLCRIEDKGVVANLYIMEYYSITKQ